jgi:Carboxylesterase family
MRLVASFPILWAALHSWFNGRPRLQLRDTVLIGRHIQHSNVDFFGGTYPKFLITTRSPHFPISGIPFAEPPVAHLRFSRPCPKHSLTPLRSFDAGSFGLPCLQPVGHPPLSALGVPTRHSIWKRVRICQRTASPSTYFDLPALI